MADGRSLETLTAEDFRDVKGSRFQLTRGRHVAFEVELTDVAQAAGLAGTFRAPFTVLFHGPVEPVLPQGIYRLEHDKLGVLDLFIVPIGPAEPGTRPAAMRYEAVFG